MSGQGLDRHGRHGTLKGQEKRGPGDRVQTDSIQTDRRHKDMVQTDRVQAYRIMRVRVRQTRCKQNCQDRQNPDLQAVSLTKSPFNKKRLAGDKTKRDSVEKHIFNTAGA